MTEAHAIGPIRALARPKALAIGCIAVLVAAGWLYLGLALAGMNSVSLLEVLCQSSFGASDFGAAQTGLILAMWFAMALAMMLPTAAPMIVTYAELAETAARKNLP